MATDGKPRNSHPLTWIVFLLVVVLIGWQLFLGATIQELGIPGIFTIKFGKTEPPVQPAPPVPNTSGIPTVSSPPGPGVLPGPAPDFPSGSRRVYSADFMRGRRIVLIPVP